MKRTGWMACAAAVGVTAAVGAADASGPAGATNGATGGAVADAAGAIMISCRVIELPAAEYQQIVPSKDISAGGLVTEALQQKILKLKDADVLSSPRVVTMPGQTAVIRVGREVTAVTGFKKDEAEGKSVPVTEQVEVGFSLSVMAEPDAADPSCLNATAEVVITDVPEQKADALAPGAVSVRTERRITSCIRVPNGGTVMLGGLPGDAGAAKAPPRMLVVLLTVSQVAPESVARCRAIVLPKVEFRDAQLTDVVQFLQQASVANDPGRKGINIVLDLKDLKPATLTLALRDIPLSEALRYVAELCGLRVKYEPQAVVIGGNR